jgi:hypothetical protein
MNATTSEKRRRTENRKLWEETEYHILVPHIEPEALSSCPNYASRGSQFCSHAQTACTKGRKAVIAAARYKAISGLLKRFIRLE